MNWKGPQAEPGGYRTYPEWTLRITVFALILGVLTTVASVYSGLKLAQVVPASAVAVMLGLLFKLRRGSILEVNMGQILTSTISVSAAGVIFTIPALYIMFTQEQLGNMPQITIVNLLLASVLGAVMGATVIVPLRRRFIEIDVLPFPVGTANALLVRVLGIPVRSIITMLVGVVIAALVEWAKHTIVGTGASAHSLLPEELALGDWLGLPVYTGTALSVSLLTIAIGFIGGKEGLPFLIGGIVAWLILGPIIANGILSPDTIAQFNPDFKPGDNYAEAVAAILLPNTLRPFGIGMFVGAAIIGTLIALPVLRGIVRTMRTARATGSEVPIRTVGLIMLAGMVLLFFVAAGAIPWWRAVLVVLIGTTYMVVANMVVTECGARTGISPVSGLSFLGAILTYFLSGGNVVVAVFLGAAICSGITQGGDMMDDLKTSHLIGGNARKAQIGQLLVAALGPVVAVFTVIMLAKGVGFGAASAACAAAKTCKVLADCTPELMMLKAQCLPAPQATALAGILGGLSGQSGLPIPMYAGGALLGALLTLLPIGGVGVLFGVAFYLPLSTTLVYGIGSLLSMLVKRVKGEGWIRTYGIPAAAGCILGESLVGVYYALQTASGIFGN